MVCTKCGKELAEGSLFCNFCGTNLSDEIVVDPGGSTELDPTVVVDVIPKKSNKKKLIGVIGIVLVILGLGGYLTSTGAFYSDEKKDKIIAKVYVNDGSQEALKVVKKLYANDTEAQDNWVLIIALQEVEKSNTVTNSANSAKYEQIKKENNIYLDAKDVQYDMVNNLDKSFGIYGTAELDDYYNYGFDDDMEEDYFCVRVRPTGGSYSDEWYVYLHRTSFKELYDKLKTGKKEVILQCKIPKYRYEKNMNNMAMCESAWY